MRGILWLASCLKSGNTWTKQGIAILELSAFTVVHAPVSLVGIGSGLSVFVSRGYAGHRRRHPFTRHAGCGNRRALYISLRRHAALAFFIAAGVGGVRRLHLRDCLKRRILHGDAL
jgi:hypothetical protein